MTSRALPTSPTASTRGRGTPFTRSQSERAALSGCSSIWRMTPRRLLRTECTTEIAPRGGDESCAPLWCRIHSPEGTAIADHDGCRTSTAIRRFGSVANYRWPSWRAKDHRVITVQRSTAVRVGVVVLVLAALGVGTAIGLTVGSKSSPPTKSTAEGASTSSVPASTTTSLPTSTTTTSSEPTVLSCGPAPTPSVRPTMLTVGCATRAVTVTAITWNTWGAETGGQGTGIINQGFQSAPAVVVVFHVVNGIFQDISVTPTKDVSSTPPTTPKPTGRTTTSTIRLPTTTTTIGGIAPVAASQPGSGWGGN